MKSDICVEWHGSIVLLRPESDPGREWLQDHTRSDPGDPDAANWFGSALVVEPRYVDDIVRGAIDSGLKVAV